MSRKTLCECMQEKIKSPSARIGRERRGNHAEEKMRRLICSLSVYMAFSDGTVGNLSARAPLRKGQAYVLFRPAFPRGGAHADRRRIIEAIMSENANNSMQKATNGRFFLRLLLFLFCRVARGHAARMCKTTTLMSSRRALYFTAVARMVSA